MCQKKKTRKPQISRHQRTGDLPVKHDLSSLNSLRHGVHNRSFHIRQVKPRDVAALDERIVDPRDRGLHIPLICTHDPQESVTPMATRCMTVHNSMQAARSVERARTHSSASHAPALPHQREAACHSEQAAQPPRTVEPPRSAHPQPPPPAPVSQTDPHAESHVQAQNQPAEPSTLHGAAGTSSSALASCLPSDDLLQAGARLPRTGGSLCVPGAAVCSCPRCRAPTP